jgi:hypothetical protein
VDHAIDKGNSWQLRLNAMNVVSPGLRWLAHGPLPRNPLCR